MASPTLLLLKGHPGSGKSTLAHALAQSLGWPLLDKDDVKDHLHTRPDGNVAAYAILWQVAARQLSLGLSVVVDSPLSYAVGYETGCKLAAAHRATLLVVETTLPEDVWRARLDARSRADSAHKIAGWAAMQAMLAQYQDCWRYPIAPEHHLVVDTTRPLAELVACVKARLTAATLLDKPTYAPALRTNGDAVQ